MGVFDSNAAFSLKATFSFSFLKWAVILWSLPISAILDHNFTTRHLCILLNQPVDNATTGVSSEWSSFPFPK
ncbi:hypothetical protein G4B88_022307 [Cannabis sativa]|uniref:Uncharacterized protein n=1 Tax=Cannabis sativa TaxID=3483 RepID=A0A7J6HV84_CANSA|nr:hypothetical protein G4B88_022307 [Cannabis sativa]